MYRLFLWAVLITGISAIVFMLIRMMATPEPVAWTPGVTSSTALDSPVTRTTTSQPQTDSTPGGRNLPPRTGDVDEASGTTQTPRYRPPEAPASSARTEADAVPLNAAGLDRQNSRAIVAGRERTEMLRSVQSNLNDMLRSGQQIDINDLDGILGRLETLQDDDGTVGGLRVSVLRDNLNAANKMMGLVEQINSAAQAGADQQTMQGYVDQLQALQQEMQTGSQDLIIPGATLPGVGDQ